MFQYPVEKVKKHFIPLSAASGKLLRVSKIRRNYMARDLYQKPLESSHSNIINVRKLAALLILAPLGLLILAVYQELQKRSHQ
jgi:hypothetical protein